MQGTSWDSFIPIHTASEILTRTAPDLWVGLSWGSGGSVGQMGKGQRRVEVNPKGGLTGAGSREK